MGHVALKRLTKRSKRLILVAVCGGLLGVMSASCKRRNAESRVKIDDGELITAESSNHVEGVFQSLTSNTSLCTGTAVSTSTALTAAHCVEPTSAIIDKDTGKVSGREYCITDPIYKKICSKEIYIDYQYQLDADSATVGADGSKQVKRGGADLAWVVFPKGTFKHVFSVQDQESLSVDDKVVLVGYSPYNLEDASKGTKRFGWNMIRRIGDHAVWRSEIELIYGEKFTRAGPSPGDSGGPLLKDCRIGGVASKGYSSVGLKVSWHTNITDPENRRTLQSASANGAYFCGLMGNDPSHCPPGRIYAKVKNYTEYSKEFPCAVLDNQD